jgi:hypothetical protein
MIAFEVHRNNQKVCVAGVGDSGVLLAAVCWFAQSAETVERVKAEGSADAEPFDLRLDVGGLRNDRPGDGSFDTKWVQDASLQIGDEVRIRLIEATEVDPPTSEHRRDSVRDLEQRKANVRRLAAELGWQIRESDSV